MGSGRRVLRLLKYRKRKAVMTTQVEFKSRKYQKGSKQVKKMKNNEENGKHTHR